MPPVEGNTMPDSPVPNRPSIGPVPPTPQTSTSPDRCAMALVLGSGERLSCEGVSFLRRRLGIASLICTFPLVFFLILNIADPETSPRWFGKSGLVFDLCITSIAAIVSILLWSPRRLTACELRFLELTLFGSTASFFAWTNVRMLSEPEFLDWLLPTLSDSSRRQVFSTYLSVTGLRWFFLIVLYGVFIPNTWKRCTILVCTAGLIPLVLTLAVALPEERLRPILVTPLFILTMIVLAAVAIAVAGSLRIHALQQEADQYRRLGQYRLHEKIGSGGMGEVHLGEHILLRRPCAIKLIHPEHASDARQLTRFEREVRAMANLTHWNTVEVFDYGRTADGTFYYVMEYLAGQNLETLVQRHGVLPPGRIIHLLRQVCLALREAHGIGLLHRDIKPSNIIACQRGGCHDVVKLLDFGLVQELGPASADMKLTMQGTILGSPPYMSPEQSRGRADLTPRSDIYGVGGVAYFLLTGQPPFVRETVMELLIAHASDPVKPPSQVRSGIPADLEAVVLRCLEKKPENRFPDAQSLERALAECASAGTWTEEMAAEWWRGHGEMVGMRPPPKPEEVSTRAMTPAPV